MSNYYVFDNTSIQNNLIPNNPNALYPGAWPLCGYMSPIYNVELLRLINAFKQLQDEKDKILFHLTCGTPIEEIKIEELNRRNCLHQKYQIIPEHLFNTASKGIRVINFIVTPNTLTTPIIIENNNFRKIDNNTYVHNIYPLEIYIFNTLIPSNDKKRIESRINNLLERNILQNYQTLDVDTLYQTDNDVKIIEIFYQTLNRTITYLINNGCFCSCFTFVVFNQSTDYYKYNNCALFKELLDCYPNTETSILYEWVFDLNICNVYSLQENTDPIICYVPPNEFNHNLNEMNNIKLLRIDMINNNLTKSYISFIQDTKQSSDINMDINVDHIINILTKKNNIYDNMIYCNCEVNKIYNIYIHDPSICKCKTCTIHTMRSKKYDIMCNEKYKLKCTYHSDTCINHPYMHNYIYEQVINNNDINYDILNSIIKSNFHIIDN